MRRLSALVPVAVLVATAAGCGQPTCSGLCTSPGLHRLDLVAGQPGGLGSVDGVGAAAHFADPWTFAGDGAGTLYLLDGSIIRAVDTAASTVTTLAGTYGITGGVDGIGPAASFDVPGGAAFFGGRLYVCDTENHTIRAIDVATGTVTTFAGGFGQLGAADGDVTAARFNEPHGIVADGAGNLYVADDYNDTIRAIAIASGTVTTIAGAAGVAGNVDAIGAQARLNRPTAMVGDGAGHLFIVDSGNSSVRVLALADGSVTTRATFALAPVGIAVDGTDILVTTGDHRVARVAVDGTVSTIAGVLGNGGFVDGAAADARFLRPAGLWVDGGRVLVADEGNFAVRAVDKQSGTTSTLLGAISVGAADGTGTTARFSAPRGIAVAAGVAWVADSGNHTIRRVELKSGTVSTVAGAPGQASFADGSGSDARFNLPSGVALDDGARHLYVADSGNRSIRVVDLASGAVTTLPTNGAPGSMFARFNTPSGLARDGTHLYVSDSSDEVVLAIDLATNLVTRVAGMARTAGANDGVGAQARFNAPSALAADGHGSVYVADTLNDAIRRIDVASGTVVTTAGVLGLAGADDGAAASAHFAQPAALALDAVGDLFVGDTINGVVRHIDLAHGMVSTVIGAPQKVGVATGPLPAQLGQPTALALTPDAHLLVASENALLVAH